MSDSFSSQEGFGVCLQQCYEAITKKHEDELLALESLRGHIFNRARADKEYAESLSRMNQKANKKVQNISQSSAVVQVILMIRMRFNTHSIVLLFGGVCILTVDTFN